MMAFTAPLQAQSLAITNSISQTLGTTATVTGSGSADNTSPWALGTVGIFQINGGVYFMKVSATNPTGTLSPAGDSLMVARTVNSQGLTDTGTLSVYVRPSTNVRWDLDLNLSFYSDSGLNTPAAISNLMLTSLDIDFNQRYYTSNANFTSNITYPNTSLVIAPSLLGYTGFTAPTDSIFSDPRNAVSSVGNGNSFDVKISHDSVALYMFEFRNPSSIIPETSSALLLLGGFAAFSLTRSRTKTA